MQVQTLNKAGSAPLSHIPDVSSKRKGNLGPVISKGSSLESVIVGSDYHVSFDALDEGKKNPKNLIAYDGPTTDTSSEVNILEPLVINTNQPVTFPPLNSSNNNQSAPNLLTVNNSSPNQESQDKEKLPSVLKSSKSVPVLGVAQEKLGGTEHKLTPKKEKSLPKTQDGNSSKSLNKKKKGQRKPALPKCNIIAPRLSMSRKQYNAKKEREDARKALAHPAHVPIDKRGPFFVRGKRTDHDQVNSKKNNSAK